MVDATLEPAKAETPYGAVALLLDDKLDGVLDWLDDRVGDVIELDSSLPVGE